MANIYIYNRGGFEGLEKEFLADKAIIRIHNIKDKDWYPEEEKGALVLFFNDLDYENLSFGEKMIVKKTPVLSNIFNLLYPNPEYFTSDMAQKTLKYISKNKTKDFVIHCEFGKSRSVAIGKYINKRYKHNVQNRTDDELNIYNTLVYKLLTE